MFQSPGVASPLRKKTKTDNVAMSSPVSKKKLPFTQEFTTSQTEQDFEAGNPEEQEQCSTPFERYIKKAESDVEKKKSELRKLEVEEKEISRRLLKVQSRPSDGNMCRNCHLRLGHTARNCSYGKCMSVFNCGEEKLHPGELNNRGRRIAINKLTSEILKMERETQLKRETARKINQSFSQQIEQTILEENSSAYTTPGGLRNWSLLRKHVYIVENYCKINYGGKLPPKHKLSNILRHALEAGHRDPPSEPLKQAKSRKNPAQSFLENHGVVFPQVINTNNSFSDLAFRCSPVTREEEEEQLNMVLKQSLIESGSENTQQARNPSSCLPNHHHSSYHGAYTPPFAPGMVIW